MIWHNSSPDQVIRELAANSDVGLSTEDVEYRLEQFGYNKLKNISKKSFLSILRSEISSNYSIALIAIAILHLVLSLFLSSSSILTSIIIISISLISTLISSALKHYSDKELGKLRNGVDTSVSVIRNGVECTIPSTQLVPGDIMILKNGDYIKADARVIDSYVLKCDEFRVTGETVPSDKLHDTIFEDISPVADRKNMVYSGSVVVNGKGLAVVTETGDNTEIAKCTNIAIETDNEITPLKAKLLNIQRIVSISIFTVAIIVFIAGIIVNFAAPVSFAVTVVDNLLLAMSIVVASGLSFIPFILNASLVFSIKRLKKFGITITYPTVAERLKDIEVICTDKTGTLTTENLKLVTISDGKKTINLTERNPDEACSAILRLALICTNFSEDEHTERHSNNMEYAIENSCIEYLGLSKADIDGMYPKVSELPFDSERMLMTTVTMINGNPIAIVKGAPEIVFSRCVDISDDTAEKTASAFASQGYKVIAVAFKQLDEIPANPNEYELEQELSFVGILGFEDTVDPVAISQCKKCIENGIRIVMITGDHINTAISIGQKLGIISDPSEAISGEELSELDSAELEEKINDFTVFARISPEEKLRIVKALNAKYGNVLVTGDSINDTPALLEANIGCALGLTASDMAKDASDIVVSDNRFYSIVHALKESKRVFLDIKKAIAHTITFLASLSLIIVIGLFTSDSSSPICPSAAMLLGLFAYILPMIGFFSEKYGGGIPFSIRTDNIFDFKYIISIIIPAIVITITALLSSILYDTGTAFATFAISLLISAFSRAHSRLLISKHTLKSRSLPIVFGLGLCVILIITLSPIGTLLSIGTIDSNGWIMVLASSAIIFVICESLKLISRFIK